MSQWDFLVDGDAAEDIMWTLCWEFCSVYKKNSAGEMLLTDRFWNSFDIWAQEKYRVINCPSNHNIFAFRTEEDRAEFILKCW